ncbi:CHAT domain-containing protein [Streptacidiphilus sp. PAMC 29251]
MLPVLHGVLQGVSLNDDKLLVDQLLPSWAGTSHNSDVEVAALALDLDDDQRMLLVTFHPRILRPESLRHLEMWADTDQRKGVLAFVTAIAQDWGSGRERWPVGAGPVERLWTMMDRRQVSRRQAAADAARPPVAGQLSQRYVDALMNECLETARTDGARFAYEAALVLLAACQASADPDGPIYVRSAVRAVAEVAGELLSRIPDGLVYQEAAAIAAARVTAARMSGDNEELAAALSLLGRFQLDAVTNGLPLEHFWDAYRTRVDRQMRSIDAIDHDFSMPDPVTVVAEAVGHLREALSFGISWIRPMTAKALVQAMLWQRLARPPWWKGRRAPRPSARALARTARQALAWIDPVTDAERYGFVLTVLREIDPSAAPAMPALRPESLRQLDGRSALIVVLRAVQSERDPGRRLELIDSVREYVRDGEPAFYYRLLLAEARAVGAQADAEHDGRRRDTGLRARSLNRHAEQLRARAKSGNWSPERLAGALIHGACLSLPADAERIGAELLAEALDMAPEIARDRPEAMTALCTALSWGEANNLGKAGSLLASNSWYGRSIGLFLALGLRDEALTCVERMAGSANRDLLVAQVLAAELLPYAALLERQVGERATELLQEVYRLIAGKFPNRHVKPEAILLLHQLAKGNRFASALSDPGPLEVDELLPTLAEISASEADVGPDPSMALDSPFGTASSLLTAYAHPREANAGATSVDRLRNLRRHFDDALTQAAFDRPAEPVLPLMLAEVQAELDDRTALITLLQMTGARGIEAISATAITRDEVTSSITARTKDYPIRSILVGARGDQQLYLHPLAFEVAALRDALFDKPDFRTVSREAEQVLERNLTHYLGYVAQDLPRWHAQGKDHLCIWAQGALHYLPFHLLYHEGVPLAEQWVVTSLTSLTSLRDRPASRTPAESILSIAACYGGRKFGFADAPELGDQARAVASVFGAQALTGDDATRDGILSRLGEARYLHIAAHGSQDAVAPAFQSLYLEPGTAGTESRVFAHDIVRSDLRSVDLASFSACESALGRFDLADNLRGLPAALMIAGCRSIVAVLWPVEPEPVGLFFTTLYERLAAGAEKRDAFRDAQQRTRQQFPHYCDWGGFVFLGDWRTPGSRAKSEAA